MTETNQGMAHVNQLLQRYLKQFRCGCSGSRLGCIVFPSFQGIFHAFKGILEQQMTRFIRLYRTLSVFQDRLSKQVQPLQSLTQFLLVFQKAIDCSRIAVNVNEQRRPEQIFMVFGT